MKAQHKDGIRFNLWICVLVASPSFYGEKLDLNHFTPLTERKTYLIHAYGICNKEQSNAT